MNSVHISGLKLSCLLNSSSGPRSRYAVRERRVRGSMMIEKEMMILTLRMAILLVWGYLV